MRSLRQFDFSLCGNAPGVGVTLQSLQIGAKIAGMLVAQVAILFKRLVNDALEFDG